jgi:phosphoglycerate dehydrogenase-like enzyme
MGLGKMGMRLSVHLLRETELAALERLRASLDSSVKLTAGLDVLPTPDYHILVAGRPKRQHIEASPNLKSLVIPWAGLPETTRALMLGFAQISVHNLHHNAVPTAELAITLLLAAAKFVVPMDRALRSHDWRPRYDPSPAVLLAGKTALILGYGSVGQQVAGMCQGLGMNVLAVRRRTGDAYHDVRAEIHPPEALHDLLPRAHVLVLCLPHTPQTDGLIGERELSLLPATAVLVNVARGAIVNEAALFRALQEGTLYAAGLDVWYEYPRDEPSRSNTPPSTYPFHTLDNVVFSPHRGGGSLETEMLRMDHLAELLNAAARGEPMPNRVDLRAGY